MIKLSDLGALPNQELSRAKFELQGGGGERWAYVHLIREAANLPIIYKRPSIGLHHEACKCVYLSILISEVPTKKNMKRKGI